MRRDSFLRGAMILTLAQLVSRVLGAVYRFPLTRMVGADGVGISGLVYPLYIILLTVSSSGINVAISKMVAERMVHHDRRGAYQVFVLSLGILSAFGLASSLLLVTGARYFSVYLFRDPRSYLSIVALAPAVFFVSVMSAYRGYFQGMQIMTPTATSQIIEQVVRVVTLLALAYVLMPYGVQYAAAGITFGAVTGAVVGLLYLFATYSAFRREEAKPPGTGSGAPASAGSVIRAIVKLAIPVSLAGLVMPFMQFLDSIIVPARLQGTGLAVKAATEQFGWLTGMAFPFINFPVMVSLGLATALVPAISEAAAVGNARRVCRLSVTGIRLTVILVLPAMVGIYLLASPLSALFYDVREAGPTLAALSTGVLFLAMQQTTSGILQGVGRMDIPVKNLAFGSIFKLILTWILAGIPAYGILGAAYGSVAAFLVSAALNVTAVYSLVNIRLEFGSLVVKPAIATVFMAALVKLSFKSIGALVKREWVATLGAVGVGVVVYGLALLALGGLVASDFRMIPRVGPPLARCLVRLRLIKDEDDSLDR